MPTPPNVRSRATGAAVVSFRVPLETGMPSLVSARAPRATAERGSVNWAFVITLFLLLGVIFMWWTAADERDLAMVFTAMRHFRH